MIGALATTLATSASAIATMLISASAVSAQEVSATPPEKRGATLREKVEHTVIAHRNVFEKPLHPLVSGVAPEAARYIARLKQKIAEGLTLGAY